jgi:hypothetical protein
MSEKAQAKSETTAPTTAPTMAQPGAAEPAPPVKRRMPWFRLTVMVLFGIVYAWDLFVAFSNFFGKLDELGRINEVRELNGFPLVETPWIPLVANLALPIVVFALGVWIARRRSVGILAVVLVAGLGVVAAVSLSIVAYVRATS